MSSRRDPDAVPTLFLAIFTLAGLGGLALLPADALSPGIHPTLLAFKLKSFALIGVAGLACAAAARAFPRWMIRMGEAQRVLLTMLGGMVLCFVGLVALGHGGLDGAGLMLPPLPAVAGPVTCAAALFLLVLRLREQRQMAEASSRH